MSYTSSFLILVIWFILNSMKQPKRRPSDISIKRYDPMASSEKIKEAILQEWKDLDFKRKSDLLPEILPKLEKVHSLPGASVPGLKEENKLIEDESQAKKSLEKLLSRFEHKKQLLLMHEIYSLPVSLRREK